MAVQAGALQLSAAAATITFVLVTGVEGLPGLGPAIFLGSASVAALVAGRAMDRFGRLPVLMCGSRPPAFSRWDLCSRLPFGRIHGRSPRASRLWFDSVAAIALALFGPGPGWIIAYVAGRAALVDLSRSIERGKLLGFGDLGAGFLAACLALVGGFLIPARKEEKRCKY